MEMHTYLLDYVVCLLGLILLFTWTFVFYKNKKDVSGEKFDLKTFLNIYWDDALLSFISSAVLILALPEFMVWLIDDVMECTKPFSWNTGFSFVTGFGGYFITQAIVEFYKLLKKYLPQIIEVRLKKLKRK